MNDVYAVVSASELAALREALATALDALAVLESGLIDDTVAWPMGRWTKDEDSLADVF